MNQKRFEELRSQMCTQRGRLQVMPASFYRELGRQELAYLGHHLAAYCFPTVQLIDWLKERIEGKKTIEIGSGNGLICDSLKIMGTDSFLQNRNHVKEIYRRMKQPTIDYGKFIVNKDGESAVKEFRPQIVIASWVTHKYDPRHHERGGNMHGVREEKILPKVKEYIFIGNEAVHQDKVIWKYPHEIIYPDWLYSRAMNGTRDFIAVWKKLPIDQRK